MKKENLLLTIIVLLVFIIGYIFGSTLGTKSQRYFFDDGKAFDTYTGEVYSSDIILNKKNIPLRVIIKYDRKTGKSKIISYPKSNTQY